MNKVALIGRLTDKPLVTYTQGNEPMAIAKYTLAVDRRGEGADFIRIVVFKKGAEFAEKYLDKGMKVAITGRIQTGSYKDKDGKTVYTTDVIAEEQEFCEKKGDATAPAQPANEIPDFMNLPEGIDEELPFN